MNTSQIEMIAYGFLLIFVSNAGSSVKTKIPVIADQIVTKMRPGLIKYMHKGIDEIKVHYHLSRLIDCEIYAYNLTDQVKQHLQDGKNESINSDQHGEVTQTQHFISMFMKAAFPKLLKELDEMILVFKKHIKEKFDGFHNEVDQYAEKILDMVRHKIIKELQKEYDYASNEVMFQF